MSDGGMNRPDERLLAEVEEYIGNNYAAENTESVPAPSKEPENPDKGMIFTVPEFHQRPIKNSARSRVAVRETLAQPILDEDLDELPSLLRAPFSETLLKLIDEKGKTDVEVYKRAHIDRKLFSKIRSIKGYVPSKRTVLALSLALELSLDETHELLECAGYSLSHSVLADVIVEYFIIHGRYDLFLINDVLYHYGQPVI
jgi:hypothetical protein